MLENIGPGESRKRLGFGIAVFIMAVIMLILMISVEIGRWWRLFLFVPFLMAALGFFQYKEKTCVALARQGYCNYDEGIERIEDSEFRTLLMQKARQIQFNALLSAAALTGLALALPD